MTREELRTAIDAIIAMFEPTDAARVREWIGYDWAWRIFAHAVLLTGGRTPNYAEIDWRDANGPVGSLVVISDRVVARVKWANPERHGPEWKYDLEAEAVPWSAVLRVSALDVEEGAQGAAAWPLRAQVELRLDRKLLGENWILLTGSGERAVAIGNVVATL